MGPSILDITNSNSLSRIYNSEFRSIQALRIAIRNEIERHGSQRSVASSGKVRIYFLNIYPIMFSEMKSQDKLFETDEKYLKSKSDLDIFIKCSYSVYNFAD